VFSTFNCLVFLDLLTNIDLYMLKVKPIYTN